MKRIALIGMPNTGKSTLFNRLSGTSARVGNWPGVTVDLMSAKLLVGGHITELVDLPGLYDIHGFSEDEQVVRHFLLQQPVDLLMIVLNSAQLDRQLSLALQVKQIGIPCILLLNMQDEAKRAGITIDIQAMANKLGLPVQSISAKYGTGCAQMLETVAVLLQKTTPINNSENISSVLEADIQIEQALQDIVSATVQTPIQINDHITDKIDQWLLHRWLGLPLFFLAIFLLFQFIFTVGSPMQQGLSWAFDTLRAQMLEPILVNLPAWLHGLLLDGIYTGVSTVAAFVPIIVLFFLVMSLVEDSGYLSRAAFLMDALMAKMGLDGRGFVMVLMGFGCNVPALMGTRVMRSRPMRLLTMLVIPFSLCSARLQVFLFLITILFSPSQAGLVMFSLYMMSFLSIFLTAVLFKRQYKNREPFVLELPPYRLPTPKQVLLRGWQEVKHFLHRASKFIVIGVVMVWLLTHLPIGASPASAETWAGQIGQFFAPVLEPLGIDAQLTIALIFGFVAKEIVVGSLAVIYGFSDDALSQHIAMQIDWVQGMSFMLFTLIYTPCVSTIATLKNESKSAPFMWFSIAWSLVLAWTVSFVFYQSVRYFS